MAYYECRVVRFLVAMYRIYVSIKLEYMTLLYRSRESLIPLEKNVM